MKRARHCLLVLFLAVFLPTSAYPVGTGPKTLWTLVDEADLIFVGQVGEIQELNPEAREQHYASARALLYPSEVLKGPAKESVPVLFRPGAVCPEQPEYSEGETVIVFLVDHPRGWFTVGNVYGALFPEAGEVEDIAGLIRAAQKLQQGSELPKKGKVSAGPPERVAEKSAAEPEAAAGAPSTRVSPAGHQPSEPPVAAAQKEWLLRAAELPTTRWHGLYLLVPNGDPYEWFHYPTYRDRFRDQRVPLEPHQLEALANAFVDAPKYNRTMVMMLRALEDYSDQGLDRYVLGVVSGLLELQEIPWWGRVFLWEALARFGDRRGQKWAEDFGTTAWKASQEELRQIFARAQAELQIPFVPPLRIEPEDLSPITAGPPR
ncbi:MAG: hypothetical protein SX243_06275 [Acidobacteriota bacterium]|nr:hypothetical protein [Acidobacteriota bacterium]